MRRVVSAALLLIAAGSGLTVLMTASWQLVVLWEVLVGLGTGSMALVFAATLTERWFVRRRGLVTGVLTALGAAGPVVRTPTAGAAKRAAGVLRRAARTKSFWFLAGGFAICGASTNGLVGTHFIPAAHDHGMPETAAASLLAVIGIFDIAGTILSGWLSDRVDSRVLLAVYYGMRGLSLLVLPQLFTATVQPSMLVFIVFYGLDWVATVPPTVALCRKIFGTDGPVVFGWVFASHQIGAALIATLAGATRDHLGSYDAAWYGAGALCLLAAFMSARIVTNVRKGRRSAVLVP